MRHLDPRCPAKQEQLRGSVSRSSRPPTNEWLSRPVLVIKPFSKSRSQQEDTAWLGVFLSENDRNQGNQQGAMVTQIYPAGPAARAIIRPLAPKFLL